MQYLKYFSAIPLCRVYQKPYGAHQNHGFVSIISKIISIYSLTLHKLQVSWILTHNALSKMNNFCSHNYFAHAWKPYGRHQGHESAYIISKVTSIWSLTLVKTAAILDFCVLHQQFWRRSLRLMLISRSKMSVVHKPF